MEVCLIKTPNDLDYINKNCEFCAYDKGASENILFLGSCRHSPVMFYYSNICPSINIYNIYTPFWNEDQRKHFPTEKIAELLPKTKIIITETISNCGILNTNRDRPNNFFETFQTKHIEEIRIPNLHLAIYLYDIINLLKKSKNDYYTTFLESLDRLKRSCELKGFEELINFVTDNLSGVRMFYTFNHPSKILSMLTFKILMKKLGEDIPIDFFHKFKEYNFLEGHCCPITKYDVDVHKFTFVENIFDESIINKKDFRYQPKLEELEISNNHLELLK